MGLFFALLGLAQLADGRSGTGAKAFAACVLLGGLWFAWRGFVSATLIVESDRVVARSFLRTRSYRMADLRGADVEVGRTGLSGFGREYLVLEVSDGSKVPFKELNARPAESPGQATIVQQAAEAICRDLRS
jgi:hypothetical protein